LKTSDITHMWQALPFLLKGLVITIEITVFGLIFGFIFGSVLGVARTRRKGLIYKLSTIFIEIIRGTPIVVQALWIYFAFPMISPISPDKILSGIIAIAINSGAYIAELVRGSIESIDHGQMEAGRSLGLTKYQTMVHIIWPQAFKRMIPPLGNQLIISLKDTSLLAIIGVVELTNSGKLYVSDTFVPFPIYTEVALIYLVITLSISYVLRKVERRIES